MVERFVLFRNHGDNTLRQILPALALKRQFMDRLVGGTLQTPDDIECFLADVREQIGRRRGKLPMAARR